MCSSDLALAIFIVTGTAILWQSSLWQKLLSVLAPVGRMALTNYILQSIVCVTIFYGFGFGYYAQLGPTAATLTALGVFVLQVLASTLWLRFFQFGPLEWIWRQLTYRQRLPLRRA